MRLLLTSLCLLFASSAAAQSADPGRTTYASRCAGCHGSDGNGGELGPASRVRAGPHRRGTRRRRPRGRPTAGMPGFAGLTAAEARDLVRFLRTLRPRDGSGPVRTTITLASRPLARRTGPQSGHSDLQLLGDDRKIHLLRKSGDATGRSRRRPTGPATTARRREPATVRSPKSTPATSPRLAPQWMFSLPNTAPLQVTPVVVDGVMYVTSANECYALDAGNGPADLALPAAADQGADRQRRRRHQSRRGGRRRARVHGDRPRAPHRARSLDRRAALGHRDGGLAPELQRDRRAARRRRSRDLRLVRRRRRRARIPRRLRSGDRQGSLALLDGARARRARLRNLAGQAASTIRERPPG